MAEKATILALFHGRRSGILWGRLSPVLLSGPGLGRALLHHRQLQLMGLVQPGVECWGLLSKCCYKKQIETSRAAQKFYVKQGSPTKRRSFDVRPAKYEFSFGGDLFKNAAPETLDVEKRKQNIECCEKNFT